MRDILFIGFCVENSDFVHYSKSDKNNQAAAWKLESRYIQGMIECGFRVTSIASFAASTYPNNSKIVFGFGYNKVSSELRIFSSAFVNLPGIKLLSRLLSTIALLGVIVFRNKCRPAGVVIYSLHQPNVVAGLIAKVIFRSKIYVIVPDMPLLMRTGAKMNMFIACFKKIDNKLLIWGSGFIDGASFICAAMRPQFPRLARNSVVIDGIVASPVTPTNSCQVRASGFSKKKIILYTGQLVESYGVRLLLGAASCLPKDYEIWIAGTGEMSVEVERVASENAQLSYLGMLSAEGLATAYNQATLLINPRLLDAEFVKFSFPSKLLEYLMSGVPVLTSRLPSIQEDLIPYFSFIDDLSVSGVANAIQAACSTNYAHSLHVALLARSYVSESRSPLSQVKRLLSIMDV